MVTKEFRKTQKETLQRDLAENKRQASLFLYQQELAKTKGIEPPKPITAEHSASVALFYMKEEIRTGDKTVEELYRLNVLKEKPARIRKTPMSKAQREQARRDRLATLQAEAEARHDARYLAHNTYQALVRTSAPPMHKPSAPPMHKRKRSLDSNESSGSHNGKRQKRAGSDYKKLVDSVEPAKDKTRKRDDHDDDVLATTTKEQSIVREKKAIKRPVPGGKKAAAATVEQAGPAKKRKRDTDDMAEEPSKDKAPPIKRARNDSTSSQPEAKTAGGSKTVEALASAKTSEVVGPASKSLKPDSKEEAQKSNTTEPPLVSKDAASASKVAPMLLPGMTAAEFFKNKRRIPLDIKTKMVKVQVQKKPVNHYR
ncbi:hypothetical protein LTR67_001759 [Exophiala xenobiotica]